MRKRWLCGLLAALMLVSVLPGLPMRTKAVETMTSSQDMIDVLKKMEGFAKRRYWDNSQWTVGYGTRCPDDMMDEYAPGETGRDITEEEAEALLRDMLKSFENEVNNFAKKYDLNFTQNEFDALVSLTYNCGGSWTRDSNGILNMAIRSGATGTDLIYAMSLYSKAHTDYVLIQRRLSEAYMYLEGVYEAYNFKDDGTYPSTYRHVFLDGNGGEVSYAIHGYDGADPQAVVTSFSKIPTGVDPEGNAFTYTFAGWYTAAAGGKKVELLDGTLANGTVLYAQWADPTGQIVELPKGDPADNLQITASQNINIRSGPGTFYPKLGELKAGSTVTITQTYLYNSVLFGKYDGGWINLTNTDYKNVLAALDNVWPKNGTVTGNNVNVRSEPSTSAERKYQLNEGDTVVITEAPYDDGTLKWGKLEDGNWICLSYVTFETSADKPAATQKVTGITLLNGPARTEYVQMQEFPDLSGTVLQVQYDDGSLSAMTLTPSMITGYSNAVLGETTVTATYQGFSVTFPVTIIRATVTFLNEDGTLLSQRQYSYGDTVVEPEVPAKPADDAGEYYFAGWSPAVTTCRGSETYTAVFRLVEEPTVPDPSGPESSDPSNPTDPSTPTEPEEIWPKAGAVTATEVNVRTGAGTHYEKAGYQLNTGDAVKIYEIVYDGSTYHWGRLEDGNWICMNYVKLLDGTVPGDIDGNESVNEDDAAYLLGYLLFPDWYPIAGSADVDKNGTVNEDDAAYLLGYLLFPEWYPL